MLRTTDRMNYDMFSSQVLETARLTPALTLTRAPEVDDWWW